MTAFKDTKVSIIIPVYNAERYVKRCINSVLNQTMQAGVEVIIINDCTPDDSMKIVLEALHVYNARPERVKMKIQILNHNINRGIAATRNTGINHATGDYVIQVDSDDWIEADMVERLYNKAIENDSDIVVCDFYNHTKHRIIRFNVHVDFNDKRSYLGKLIEGYNVVVWNKLVKRALYEKNNIRCIEGLDYGEDSIIMLQLYYYAHKIIHMPVPLYHHEIGNVYSICNNMTEKVKRNAIDRVEFARSFLSMHNLTGYDRNWAYYAFHMKAILIYNYNCPKDKLALKKLFPEADKYLSAYLKETTFQNRLILTGHMKFCHIYMWFKKIGKCLLKRD